MADNSQLRPRGRAVRGRTGVLLAVALLLAACGGRAAATPEAVPYSDEALYTELETRTDCPAMLDDFNRVMRERDRAEGEAKRWATHYWAALGARVAELHCASR